MVLEQLKTWFENHAFGVCTWLGEVTGVASGSIRMFFIYISFLTLGSPVVIYLSLAFVLNMHRHLRRCRSTIWDF